MDSVAGPPSIGVDTNENTASSNGHETDLSRRRGYIESI